MREVLAATFVIFLFLLVFFPQSMGQSVHKLVKNFEIGWNKVN